MDSTPFISGQSLWSSSLIFTEALLDWATLRVDPSGDSLPTHVTLPLIPTPEHNFRIPHTQTAQQRQEWQALISAFYRRIMKRVYAEDDTFSSPTIAMLQAWVAQLPSYEQLVQSLYYPEPMWVGINNIHHATENRISRRLTEYMLHLSQDDALQFLEYLVILWAAQLPADQVQQLKKSLGMSYLEPAQYDIRARSYALYTYVAEQFER